MLYHENGRVGLQSVIGLGCWNFGGQWNNKVSKDAAIEIIRYAIDHGITFVDVAESYGIPDGQCEILLGEALANGYREKVTLISKVGWYARRTADYFSAVDGYWRKQAKKAFNQLYRFKEVDFNHRTPELLRLCGHACCGRLKTDYVDILLCHDDKPKDASSFITAFRQLRDEGFIRYYGISTNDIGALQRFYELSNGECAACECDYSLLNRRAETELFKFCHKNNIAIFTRGTLERGILSGKYTASSSFDESCREAWNLGGKAHKQYLNEITEVEKLVKTIEPEKISKIAYQFAFSHEVHPCVVTGCTCLEQLKDNLAAAESYINPHLLNVL